MDLILNLTAKRKRHFGIFLFLLFTTQLFGQSGQEIVDNYFTAVSDGDPSKWLNVKSVYTTSISYFDAATFQSKVNLLNENPPSYQKMWKVWPDHQREELYSDSLYTDLTSLFYFLPNKHVILLKGVPPMETRPKKNVWFDFYPIRIRQYVKESTEIKLTELKSTPGKSYKLQEVRIKTKDGNEHFLLFNPSNFLLEGIYFPEASVYWTLSDYREFDGYLIPARVTAYKNGLLFSTSIYTSFTFNGDIDPKLFIPAK